MKSNKIYAVRSGFTNNVIVNSWDECKALTNGYSGAEFKSFPASKRAEAEAYINGSEIQTTSETFSVPATQITSTVQENDNEPLPWN